jgi:uncharacterized protein YegL
MGKTKTNSEMLHALRQYNKTARETKAVKEGFATASEMDSYLSEEIRKGKGGEDFCKPSTSSSSSPSGSKKSSSTKKSSSSSKQTSTSSSSSSSSSNPCSRPIIHVVDVLDSSGSMHGPKIKAAIQGINSGVTSLQHDQAPVDYTYTLCDFSEDIIFRQVMTRIFMVPKFEGETRGSTALFDAIGRTIEKLAASIQPGEKVLVNIYTDGQENSSRYFRAETINSLIKSWSEKGWTFTFIGTPSDVDYVKDRLYNKDSNTLVYDGTAKGLEKSFIANTAARSNYSQKVSKGEDVSEGFYKDIN